MPDAPAARRRLVWGKRPPRGLFPDNPVVEVALHPSTESAAIAAAQRADVAACLADRERWADDPFDLAAISADVVLCTWVVWRRLGELGYALPQPAPKRKSGPKRDQRHHMKLPTGN